MLFEKNENEIEIEMVTRTQGIQFQYTFDTLFLTKIT